MRTLSLFLFAGLASLSIGCTTRPNATPQLVEAKLMVPTVFVIRHMEKAAGDDPVLSAEGEANARRIAEALRDKDIGAIFVTATRRSRLSGEPLSALTGARIETYDPKDIQALVARVAAIPGSVFVVGHSNTVPAIVAAFGGPAIGDMAETDYGRLFAVRKADGATVESRP